MGLQIIGMAPAVCQETDCMQLMHAFGKEGQDRSRWSVLFKEIRDTLRLLPDVKIGHVRTKQNQVAHGIAQLVLRQVMRKTSHFVPAKVARLVDEDRPGLVGPDNCCNFSS
jgi:hypothetical protein